MVTLHPKYVAECSPFKKGRTVKAWQITRKVLVFLIGVPLFGLGLVLIPLPGPGLLLSLLALALLATEAAWAQPFLKRRQAQLQRFWQEYKRRQKEIDERYK